MLSTGGKNLKYIKVRFKLTAYDDQKRSLDKGRWTESYFETISILHRTFSMLKTPELDCIKITSHLQGGYFYVFGTFPSVRQNGLIPISMSTTSQKQKLTNFFKWVQIYATLANDLVCTSHKIL